tara:strand:+ start:1772 stop:2065 length:294 start_codon:yes stop_codon:yes gene_type:complete
MLVKIHKQQGKSIIAICDKELIGQNYEENNLQLDLTSDFYKGEEKTVEHIADVLRNCDIINLVGKKSIQLGLKEGILTDDEIKTIQGVPHAQVVLID